MDGMQPRPVDYRQHRHWLLHDPGCTRTAMRCLNENPFPFSAGLPLHVQESPYEADFGDPVGEILLRQRLNTGYPLCVAAALAGLSAEDLMTDKRNAIRIDLFGKRVTAVNLFSRAGEYQGCVCLLQGNGDFSDGEDSLAEKLAEFITLAAEKNPQIISDPSENIKRILMTLIDEMPLSRQQRMLLTSMEGRSTGCLVCMRQARAHNQLPLTYICGIFEDRFEGASAFVHEDSIVAVIPVASLKPAAGGDYRISLNRMLSDFLGRMGLQTGISNEFSSLLNVRINYLQAQSALENGTLISPSGSLFYFESFALAEMIINSLGGLPLETYYPAGFRQLLEHDKESEISWLETVRVFLEENLSYTAASRKLYIHRSTLIDRITRIEKELGIDLKDPDRRLQLEILLKAIELEEMLRMQYRMPQHPFSVIWSRLSDRRRSHPHGQLLQRIRDS